MPAKEQILLHEATALLAEENVNGAFAKISEAFGLAPNDINIRFAYVEIAIRAKKLTEARTALEGVDANNRLDKIYGDLEAALTLAEKNQQNPEIDILQNKLKQNPDDLDNVEKLCTALSQSGKATEALDLLFNAFFVDWRPVVAFFRAVCSELQNLFISGMLGMISPCSALYIVTAILGSFSSFA